MGRLLIYLGDATVDGYASNAISKNLLTLAPYDKKICTELTLKLSALETENIKISYWWYTERSDCKTYKLIRYH